VSDKTTTVSGIGFPGLLTLIFITLKLCGVIDWSWWWALSPLLIFWGARPPDYPRGTLHRIRDFVEGVTVSDNRYFGSKNQLYQKLINLIPRHSVYIEAFAGKAAVGRNLLPCASRVFIERDPVQCRWLEQHLAPPHQVLCGDAVEMLRSSAYLHSPHHFVFLDPPYPIRDRRAAQARYRYEMTDEDHHSLLYLLTAWSHPARIMVCGFPWGCYNEELTEACGWHRHTFKVVLRGGRMGSECVWTNYADPYPLHDYRYWGDDKRVRLDTRRLISRTVAKLRRLDPHRRQAVIDAIARDVLPSTAGIPAIAAAQHRGKAALPSAAASGPFLAGFIP
jgi:hypothetical protein